MPRLRAANVNLRSPRAAFSPTSLPIASAILSPHPPNHSPRLAFANQDRDRRFWRFPHSGYLSHPATWE
ncbi:hypothetical protein [Phormidium sp. CCY1219]|uniref:hypothetical protein n=1 Tax=Phormidium sp. CCY1219 TaxID=2886104 RepID=UPI002D776A25|nr:hypothetical protein [Phormidium sp. CCY1219]